jgi:hypothetical protein
MVHQFRIRYFTCLIDLTGDLAPLGEAIDGKRSLVQDQKASLVFLQS